MKPFPWRIEPKNDDEKFMIEALKEAWKAYGKEEVPVGAVLVKDQRIIARGYNQVEMLNDATAHAEMLCLTSGEVAEENWRLIGTTLYCTAEPCSMCAGAMFLTRIHTLVWGTLDHRHGANGSWVNLFDSVHPIHQVQVRSGVLAGYCSELMTQFFREQREQKRNKVSGEDLPCEHP